MSNELAVMLKEHKKDIVSLAPKYINKERMLSIFLEAVNHPKIQACTKISVLKAAKRMAEMGTDIVGAGGAWLVPYGNILTVIPDWRLLVEKARRAGVIRHASAEVVYDSDVFSYERGMHPNLVHKPNMKRGNLVGVYCVYTLPDGDKDFTVMTLEEVNAIRDRSKAKDFGPWKTDFEEMAKKTVIRRALKIFEGASSELSKVFEADNQTNGFPELEDPEPISEPKAIDVTALEKEVKTEHKQEKEPLIANLKEKKATIKDKPSPEPKPQDKDTDQQIADTLPFSPITNQQIAALKKICKRSALEGPALTKFIQDFFSPAYSGKIEDLTSVEAGEVIKELQTI